MNHVEKSTADSTLKTDDSIENGSNRKAPKWMYYIAGYHIILIVFSIWGLIQAVSVPLDVNKDVQYSFLWISKENVPPISKDLHLVLVATLAGAHGGLLHGLARLAYAARVKKMMQPLNAIWHIERPFIGAGLAIAVYFLFRSGMLSNIKPEELNVYAIAAVGVITGLAEARAIDKLREVFKTMFGPRERRVSQQVVDITNVDQLNTFLSKGYTIKGQLPNTTNQQHWILEKILDEDDDSDDDTDRSKQV